MSLSIEERQTLVGLQIEKSDKFMSEADANAAMGMWDVVANRIYYATFHAMAAMFIKDGLEVRSHKGSVLVFGKNYVSTGLFSLDSGRLYAKLQVLQAWFMQLTTHIPIASLIPM